ncbi:MAG: TlpA disulfide reductase family protein [Flavobacteriales bacterium]|nr:TlpA disulfide reductase family protein [Flavobacteriales bacterium]
MEMLRSLFLILFISLNALSLQAETQVLSGSAPGSEGKELYLLKTTDFLSNGWYQVATSTIQENGEFGMQLDVFETGHYTLRVGSWYAEIYLSPGTSYEIKLEKDNASQARTFDQNQFEITFESIAPNDPNIVISSFNQSYESLFGELNFSLAQRFNKGSTQYKRSNEEELIRTNIIAKIDSALTASPDADSTEVLFLAFKETILQQLTSLDKPFTQRMLSSALGRLDIHLGKNKLDAWEMYLQDSLIYPGNPEWMGLFLEVHSQLVGHPDVVRKDVVNAIQVGSYASLMESLEKYPLVITSEQRDLLALSIAKESWYKGASFRMGVLQVLDAIAIGDWCTERIRFYAQQLRYELTRGTPYAKEGLPFDLTLLDYKGERVDLESFKGQLMYVGFFLSNSPASQRELSVMEGIYKQYGRQVKFVLICMDEDPSELSNYLSSHKNQDWTILQAGGDPRIRHHMNLKAVPQFYFISPDGLQMETYSLRPSEGVERRMAAMLKAPRPEKLKVWDD